MQRATLGERRPGFRKHYHLVLIHGLSKQLHLHYTTDKVNKDSIRQDAQINGLSMLETSVNHKKRIQYGKKSHHLLTRSIKKIKM
jgi:hypothetical protein